MTLATSLEERGVAGLVPVVDVGAALQEQFDDVLLSLSTSQAQHLVQAYLGLSDRSKDALRGFAAARVRTVFHFALVFLSSPSTRISFRSRNRQERERMLNSDRA